MVVHSSVGSGGWLLLKFVNTHLGVGMSTLFLNIILFRAFQQSNPNNFTYKVLRSSDMEIVNFAGLVCLVCSQLVMDV